MAKRRKQVTNVFHAFSLHMTGVFTQTRKMGGEYVVSFWECLDRRPRADKGNDGVWETQYVWAETDDDVEPTYYAEYFTTGHRRPDGRSVDYLVYEWSK